MSGLENEHYVSAQRKYVLARSVICGAGGGKAEYEWIWFLAEQRGEWKFIQWFVKVFFEKTAMMLKSPGLVAYHSHALLLNRYGVWRQRLDENGLTLLRCFSVKMEICKERMESVQGKEEYAHYSLTGMNDVPAGKGMLLLGQSALWELKMVFYTRLCVTWCSHCSSGGALVSGWGRVEEENWLLYNQCAVLRQSYGDRGHVKGDPYSSRGCPLYLVPGDIAGHLQCARTRPLSHMRNAASIEN